MTEPATALPCAAPTAAPAEAAASSPTMAAAAAAGVAAPTPTPTDRAAIWNACGWGALLCWQLLLSRAVIRSAGAEAWGLWATIAAFKSFVLFFDGGLAQGIVRDAGCDGPDGALLRLRIRSTWRLYGAIAVIAVVVAVALAPWAADYLGLRGELARVAPALVLVHGVDAGLALAAGPLPAILRGRRLFGALALTNVLQAVLGCALLWLLIAPFGVLGAAGAVVGARVATTAACWRWLRRRQLLPARDGDPRTVTGSVMRTVVPIWIMVAATQMAMRADVPVVGWFFGAGSAGHYDLGQQLPFAAMSLLIAILSFALPRFVADLAAGDTAAGDRAALHRQVPRIVFMACMLAGLGFGTLAFLAEDLLLVWIGSAPPQSVAVARIYAAAWASNAAVHVLVQVAIAHGRFSMLTWPVVAGSLANFAISVALASNGCEDGPAWATLWTMGLWDLALVPAILIVGLRLPAGAIVRGALGGWAIGGIAAAALAGAVVAMALAPTAAVVFAIVAVAIVAAVVLDTTVRRRSLLRSLFRRLPA